MKRTKIDFHTEMAKIVQGHSWGSGAGHAWESIPIVTVGGRKAEWIGAYDDNDIKKARGHQKVFKGSTLVMDQQGKINLVRYLPAVVRHIGRGGNYLVLNGKTYGKK